MSSEAAELADTVRGNMDKLKNRDYYLIIDQSGSMSATDTPTGKSRWSYAQETTEALARKLNEFDPDGITVIPFAGGFTAYDNTTPEKVHEVFANHEPVGGTVLTPPLKYCFDDYLKNKAAGKAKQNGAIVVVITDGAPQDEENVASAISAFTKKLSDGREEFGISLIQVGKDTHAAKYLKRLDDDLQSQGAKYDIVDTKTMEELESKPMIEAILASLTD